LKPKLQPTDLSENKNLAQGIKINVCQHPSTSAFKLVSSASITSQNNQALGGFRKNVVNDTLK
jgi:hypothetical protein